MIYVKFHYRSNKIEEKEFSTLADALIYLENALPVDCVGYTVSEDGHDIKLDKLQHHIIMVRQAGRRTQQFVEKHNLYLTR